ncbi:membrane-anchored junction protein isoform X4 [Talpa occidentalis]|uniref:membrane-anchored junction protein isoform X4 n=1 Tax=Talpa occidentalis TaxID=50954 RepID=UPI0023F6B0C5|nr:membrane-anchored junction protein isoform X4 [Talpa occidentalis]
MSLKPFTYPFPETRFLHAGPSVYKFKIRYGNSIRGEEIEKKEVVSQELEDSIRVVLGNLENLQPFATEHFIVFPYKSKWERVSHLKFKHGDMALVPYPFVFTLYVELKWFHENLSPGKPINDSPPGLVLADRKAAGAMVRKWKCMEVPRSPSVSGLDSIKMGTSSQGPRKKKPLMETRRLPDLRPKLWKDKTWGEQVRKWNGPELSRLIHTFFPPPLLEPYLAGTGKPSRNGRRPQRLMTLMSRNRHESSVWTAVITDTGT